MLFILLPPLLLIEFEVAVGEAASSPDVVDCKIIFCTFVIIAEDDDEEDDDDVADIDDGFVVIVSKYKWEDNCGGDDEDDVAGDVEAVADVAVIKLAAKKNKNETKYDY